MYQRRNINIRTKCIAISTSAIQTKTKCRRNTQYSENPTDIYHIRFQRPRNPRMIQARNQAIDTNNARDDTNNKKQKRFVANSKSKAAMTTSSTKQQQQRRQQQQQQQQRQAAATGSGGQRREQRKLQWLGGCGTS